MTEEKKQDSAEEAVKDNNKNKKDKKEKKKKDNWKEKCSEFEHKYKLALADYQNLMKRTAEEKQEFSKYANEQFVMEILPVYDNLKVSMEHIDEAAKTSGWAEGIKYVIKQFKDVLANMGVEEIEVLGKKFDHNTMEALEGQGDKVKKVVKAGYKMRDKVIAPAKVILE
jgi:molecular chaperone GrpE